MKRLFIIFASVLAIMPTVTAQLTDPDMLPDSRQVVEIPTNERNPFAQKVVVQTQVEEEDTKDQQSEEARLRKIFSSLKVSGLTTQGGTRQILLGGIALKQGQIVPQILQNQTEQLRVESIGEKELKLAFVRQQNEEEDRSIRIALDMKPRVRQLFFGNAVEEMLVKSGPLPLLDNEGADEFLDGSKEADFKNISERNIRLMGETGFQQPQALEGE